MCHTSGLVLCLTPLRPCVGFGITRIRRFEELGLSIYVPGFLTSPVYLGNMYVVFSVSYYFENKDSPIICCRNSGHVRGTAFNFGKESLTPAVGKNAYSFQ